MEALRALSLASFAGCLALGYAAVRRGTTEGLARLALLAIFLSSALYQATAGFGEMLAATAVLAAVVACIYQRPGLIVLTSLLAVLSKDTVAPFVLALGLLAAGGMGRRWLPPRRVTIPLSVGVTLGVGAHAAFNLMRFGSVLNQFYLQPKYRTPTELVPEFWLAEWMSPSGGIAWYWPITTALLALTALTTVGALRRTPRDVAEWGPRLALLAIAVAWTMGLAFWYTPFGWITAGPRLAVPLLPAITVLAVRLNADVLVTLGRRVPGSALLAAAAAGCAAALFTPLPWHWFTVVRATIAPSPHCPDLTKVLIERPGYYDCAQAVMRRRQITLLAPAATHTSSTTGVAVGTAAVLLLSARTRQPRRSEASAAPAEVSRGE